MTQASLVNFPFLSWFNNLNHFRMIFPKTREIEEPCRESARNDKKSWDSRQNRESWQVCLSDLDEKIISAGYERHTKGNSETSLSNCSQKIYVSVRFGHDFPTGQFVSVRSYLIAATTWYSGLFLLPLVTRFECDIGQLARIWIWVSSEVITILVSIWMDNRRDWIGNLLTRPSKPGGNLWRHKNLFGNFIKS